MRLRILLALAAAFVAKDDRPGDCGSSKPGCAGTWTRGLVSTDRVILEDDGTLAVYDSGTGSLRKTFHLQGSPENLQALAVHGSIAVYSKPVRFKTGAVSEGAVHAINLATGKDRVVGRLGGAIPLASIDSAGLVYASNLYGASKFGNGTVVFLPLAKVAAAVS